MKKILTFILTFGLCSGLIISAGSCTREYTCQCVMTYSGSPGLPDSTVRDYTIRDTKNNARDLCQGNSKVYQEGTIVTHEDCDLW